MFDSTCDKDREKERDRGGSSSSGSNYRIKPVIDAINAAGKDVVEDRIKEMNKGKTTVVYRYNGQTVDGEPAAPKLLTDPRKAQDFRRSSKGRGEFHVLHYEVRVSVVLVEIGHFGLTNLTRILKFGIMQPNIWLYIIYYIIFFHSTMITRPAHYRLQRSLLSDFPR